MKGNAQLGNRILIAPVRVKEIKNSTTYWTNMSKLIIILKISHAHEERDNLLFSLSLFGNSAKLIFLLEIRNCTRLICD